MTKTGDYKMKQQNHQILQLPTFNDNAKKYRIEQSNMPQTIPSLKHPIMAMRPSHKVHSKTLIWVIRHYT